MSDQHEPELAAPPCGVCGFPAVVSTVDDGPLCGPECERYAIAARTGRCPDCGRHLFSPGCEHGPTAQILAGHAERCTGVR